MTNAELNKTLHTLNRRIARLNEEIGHNAPNTIIGLEISLIQESLIKISSLLK